MKIFNTISDTKRYLNKLKKQAFTVGFVPTMGALHEGHLSLIRKADQENDIVACSIFVNPIQFNNKEDLERYPRTAESDIEKLKKSGCDVLFMPDNNEMYPEPEKSVFDFGHLDKIMEGKFRPGHFNGVAIVVKKLFEIIEPHKAYFGEKDYQQLAVIRNLVKNINNPVEIISCPTIREDDGLALSSRNIRLSREERKIAPYIYKILKLVKDEANDNTPGALINMALAEFQKIPEFEVEYFEIVDPGTLLAVDKAATGQKCRALTAVKLGKIRLIDNIEIFF